MEPADKLLVHFSQFRRVGFCGEMKTEEPEKDPWVKNENRQQTEPTFYVGFETRTRMTMMT